jgi:hypothetical protein
VGHLVGAGFTGHRVGQKGFREGTRVGRYVTPPVGFIVSITVAGEKDAVEGGASGEGDGVGGLETMGTHNVCSALGVVPAAHTMHTLAFAPETEPGAHFMHFISGVGE